jgi:hypothetical protein
MPPVQLTTPTPTYGQKQLTCPSRAPFLPLLLCAARACLLCHRAEPSPPFLSHSAARVASTQCTAIKGNHPLRLVRTSVVSTSGKPSPPHSPLFSSVPSHLTPPLSLYTGPRASPEPRAAPQPEGPTPSPTLSSGAVDRAGELCLSVVHPPHFDSMPGTMSGRCAKVHGCFPWTYSHGSFGHRPSLAAPHRAPVPCGPRHGLSMVSALGHAMPTSAPSLGSSAMCNLAIG